MGKSITPIVASSVSLKQVPAVHRSIELGTAKYGTNICINWSTNIKSDKSTNIKSDKKRVPPNVAKTEEAKHIESKKEKATRKHPSVHTVGRTKVKTKLLPRPWKMFKRRSCG